MIGYYRACPEHLCELDDELRCPVMNHRCDTWLVRCDDGTLVGKAWEDKNKILVGPDAMKGPRKYPMAKPPHRPCLHGHTNWVKRPNGRYQCRDCNRRTWQRQQERRTKAREKRARLHERREG